MEYKLILYIVHSILYIWADRWIGGGFGWEKLGKDNGGPLKGGGLPYAMLVLLPTAWFAGGLPLTVFAFSWCVWRRFFGWDTFGHETHNPTRKEDLPYTIYRHSYLALSILALYGIIWHALPRMWPDHFTTPTSSVLPYLIPAVLFAPAATKLAYMNGAGTPNRLIEEWRGTVVTVLLIGLLVLRSILGVDLLGQL